MPPAARAAPRLLPLHAPPFAERFQCIGARCEDHCCSQWQVSVDRAHYLSLKQAMAGSRAEREEFRRTHVRDRDATSERGFARMTLQPGGDCSMLDGAGWCRIQARYGERHLPDVCATYPRQRVEMDGRMELTLKLSCPEVARLALFEERPAELVPVSPALAGRPQAGLRLDAEASPYLRYHADVRAAALWLLSRTEYPVETRLFFLAFLGQRTAPFLHHQTGDDVGERLAVEIVRLERPEVLAELAARFAELTIPGPLAEMVALWLLEARMATAQAGWQALVSSSLRAYFPAGPDGQPAASSSGEELMAGYRRARAGLPELLAARLDRIVTRFCEQQWIARPHAMAPSLLVYVQELALRAALIRILLLGHPRAQAALAASTPEEQLAHLDAGAVEVVFRLSRAIDHDEPFLRTLGARLAAADMVGFPWAVALTRL